MRNVALATVEALNGNKWTKKLIQSIIKIYNNINKTINTALHNLHANSFRTAGHVYNV